MKAGGETCTELLRLVGLPNLQKYAEVLRANRIGLRWYEAVPGKIAAPDGSGIAARYMEMREKLGESNAAVRRRLIRPKVGVTLVASWIVLTTLAMLEHVGDLEVVTISLLAAISCGYLYRWWIERSAEQGHDFFAECGRLLGGLFLNFDEPNYPALTDDPGTVDNKIRFCLDHVAVEIEQLCAITELDAELGETGKAADSTLRAAQGFTRGVVGGGATDVSAFGHCPSVEETAAADAAAKPTFGQWQSKGGNADPAATQPVGNAGN